MLRREKRGPVVNIERVLRSRRYDEGKEESRPSMPPNSLIGGKTASDMGSLFEDDMSVSCERDRGVSEPFSEDG